MKHAAVRVEAHERKRLEQLCRSITRPALADERVQLNAAGQVELKLKSPRRDGTTHLVMNPLEILQRVNAQLCAENQANLFVTMILGIVETGTGRMVYGQGGHNPPILVRSSGDPVYEPSGGMPLGVFEDAKFGERTLELKAGETLLVYTDGVTEAMNPQRELFGEERLKEAVRGQAKLSTEKLAERVVQQVAQFARGAEPSDDITLLALKHRLG